MLIGFLYEGNRLPKCQHVNPKPWRLRIGICNPYFFIETYIMHLYINIILTL